ncbi:hypothetical protein Maq22A_1p38340 (plasmid) [Methylobacterium aquaticum]|uniref:Uncharacterized protein n=1 Tax=Methylobacterium aquaticum TaxID=270351 RepID=A0A1Y0ZGE9_9HYPH|nr:hypothetical protein Maq22A_1p38340 [Methylobacterium aquaticum]
MGLMVPGWAWRGDDAPVATRAPYTRGPACQRVCRHPMSQHLRPPCRVGMRPNVVRRHRLCVRATRGAAGARRLPPGRRHG